MSFTIKTPEELVALTPEQFAEYQCELAKINGEAELAAKQLTLNKRTLPKMPRGIKEAARARLIAIELIQWTWSDDSCAAVINIGDTWYQYNRGWSMVDALELERMLEEVYTDSYEELVLFLCSDFVRKSIKKELRVQQYAHRNGWKGLNLPKAAMVMGDTLVRLSVGGEFSVEDATPNNSSLMQVPFRLEELEGYDYTNSAFYKQLIERMFKGRDEEAQYLGAWFLHEMFDGHSDTQRFPIFMGVGGSGKSTLTDAILHMVNECNQQGTYGDFTEIISESSKFNMAQLCTKRFVFVQDTTMKGNVNWDRLKNIAAKGSIIVEEKFLNPERMQVTASMVANTNNPNVDEYLGYDAGIRRRIALYRFNEAVPEHLRDQTLASKLQTLEEQRAVWAWMLAQFKGLASQYEDCKSMFSAVPDSVRICADDVDTSEHPTAKVLRNLRYDVQERDGWRATTVRLDQLVTKGKKFLRGNMLGMQPIHDASGLSLKEVEGLNSKRVKEGLQKLDAMENIMPGKNARLTVYEAPADYVWECEQD